MAISEQITVEIASVEVNDEYRVELAQLRRVTDYSPQQAMDLANELVRAAGSALEAIDADMDERHERMRAGAPRTVDGRVVL
ncbi:MAG: hypothetical protein WDA07_05525 [Leucobacter sp.]